MRAGKTYAAVLLAISAQLAFADSKQITGTVFIVTNSHESVKLGLVPISVYPIEQVKSAIQLVDEELQTERKSISDLGDRLNEATSKIGEISEKLSTQSIHSTTYDPGLWALSRRALQLHADLLRLKLRVSSVSNYLSGSSVYFKKINELHKPVATGKTDADGKYSISLPESGDLAILAYSERRVFDKTEEYFWAVHASGDHIDLSNDNLTSSTGGGSVLHIAVNDSNAVPISREELLAEFEALKGKYADVFKPRSDASGSASDSTVQYYAIPLRAVLKHPITFHLPKRDVTLPRGSWLELISRKDSEVLVRYRGQQQTIQLSDVDLK